MRANYGINKCCKLKCFLKYDLKIIRCKCNLILYSANDFISFFSIFSKLYVFYKRLTVAVAVRTGNYKYQVDKPPNAAAVSGE